MRKLLTIITLITLSFTSKAQINNGKVNGTVIDGSAKIIESATISLLRIKDSSVAKIAVANKNGQFSFENVAEGSYVVSISAVGHSKGFSEAFEISPSNLNVTLKTIELVALAKI